MNRMLVVAISLLSLTQTGLAQVEPEVVNGKVTFPMMLSPTASPKPLSKYYLYPEYGDLQPGERVSGFMKCFMEQAVFYNNDNEMKRHAWNEMALKDLPADVRQQAGVYGGIAYSPKYATMMVFMDQAARYTRTDWNEWFNLRNDGVWTLLPEVQKMRSLANVLKLRLRGEIKNGEFDRAIQTCKTMFGLAQALEQHPTLIGNLVGIAIDTIALNALEEMVQQPGCPNLFWSFVDLPRPLLSIRRGMEGERIFLIAQFKAFLVADRAFTDAEMEQHLAQIAEVMSVTSSNPNDRMEQLIKNPRIRYSLLAADTKRIAAARERLVKYGKLKPEAVKTFPPLQVVIADDLLQFEITRDELTKGINLPNTAERQLFTDERLFREKHPDLLLANLLLPAIIKVREASTRLEQRVAYLQVIEAVRWQAHENGGKLPQTLADIKLPVPMDPVSGKAFSYTVDGDTATIHGENPHKGLERTNRYYSIQIRK